MLSFDVVFFRSKKVNYYYEIEKHKSGWLSRLVDNYSSKHSHVFNFSYICLFLFKYSQSQAYRKSQGSGSVYWLYDHNYSDVTFLTVFFLITKPIPHEGGLSAFVCKIYFSWYILNTKVRKTNLRDYKNEQRPLYFPP